MSENENENESLLKAQEDPDSSNQVPQSSDTLASASSKTPDPNAQPSAPQPPQPPQTPQTPPDPAITSNIGGKKGKAEHEPTALEKALQKKIDETDKEIAEREKANNGINPQSTADMHALAGYKPTFVLKGLNWLRQKALNTLKDDNAGEVAKFAAKAYAEITTNATFLAARGIANLIALPFKLIYKPVRMMYDYFRGNPSNNTASNQTNKTAADNSQSMQAPSNSQGVLSEAASNAKAKEHNLGNSSNLQQIHQSPKSTSEPKKN